MHITPEAKAPEPVSKILREAARVGLEIRPEDLPTSGLVLYEAVYDSLFPRLNFKRPQRQLIALDTTGCLCDEHAGQRLTPSLLATKGSAVQATIIRCFTAHGGSIDWLPLAVTSLQISCFGGLDVPNLQLLALRLRNVRIRRAYHDGDDYDTLANRHDLTSMQIRRITAVRDA